MKMRYVNEHDENTAERKRVFVIPTEQGKGRKKRTIKTSLAIMLLLPVLLTACATAPPEEKTPAAVADVDGRLTVTFLDVGQGNAVLVENDGLFMLIDGGDREYSSFVVSYLKQQGVEELAYVVASHYDADHINGIVGALHAFPCKQVLAPEYATDTRVYDSFCEVIEEEDIALAYPAVGETYTLGDAAFTIVCPEQYGAKEANDNSIGLRLAYGDNSFLICGDAGVEMEEKMLSGGVALDSDVYLASHHGSGGSSSPEFLEAVSPQIVVISVGADNSYGHPAQRVLDDIAKVGAGVYRTDECGTIRIASDGEQLTVTTERTAAESLEEAGPAAAEQTEAETVPTYILNLNTKKFHDPSCPSVDEIHPGNKAEFTGTREELLAAGYDPCGRCKP